LLNDENIIREFTLPRDERDMNRDRIDMIEDYNTIPFLRGIIEKLSDRQLTKSKAEAELEDMQAKAE